MKGLHQGKNWLNPIGRWASGKGLLEGERDRGEESTVMVVCCSGKRSFGSPFPFLWFTLPRLIVSFCLSNFHVHEKIFQVA